MAIRDETKANGYSRRERQDFARIPTIIDLPNLIEVQQKSYSRFLQQERPPMDREDRGLEAVFKSVFPIEDFNGTSTLEYVGYEIGMWESKEGEFKGLGGNGVVCQATNQPLSYHSKYDLGECRQKGITYADPLRVLVRLVVREKGSSGEPPVIRDVKEQKVYLGEVPLMTEHGTFVINGTERVIVSQLHRSPGVFFAQEKGRSTASGKPLYVARVIPYRGSWLDFEFDLKDHLYVRIDRRRKLPVTILLRALGLSSREILQTFYQHESVRYAPERDLFYKEVSELSLQQQSPEDVLDPKSGEVIVRAGRRISRSALRRLQNSEVREIPAAEEWLVNRVVADDIIDPVTGEVLYELNHELTSDDLAQLKAKGVTDFRLLFLDPLSADISLRLTLMADRLETKEEALLEIYKRLRPGDIPTKETARLFFDNLFFNAKRYDLSTIGRLKLNTKLGLDLPLETRMLTQQDVIEVVRYLLALRQGNGTIDDIDHLGNRRVRSVGELLENQLRIGLVRMERAVRERMSIQDLETAMPHDLINSKPVTSAVKEFFGSSQLSQFMDQTNPLSEITHKRRLSALGPGGLTRDRAGFEVRDVHPTHYGRICPIETPEGPNIGLIASLSTYARVNRFGFIETPYRKVEQGRVTDEIKYLSAIEEDQYVTAQANAEVTEKGEFVQDVISARIGGEFVLTPPSEINFMDVSPKQLVSVAASLIPFLENDDANRALMGSNMQRQAVPLLQTESPIVGTGMETIAARDSGAVVLAKAAGEVVNVDATRIVVRVDEKDDEGGNTRVDIYSLVKYQRSNQSTCINQRPIVGLGQRVSKGEVLADGPSTEFGELALGRNVLVAFMPWGGYNFEDAIVISERVVKEDIFTSIHIEEFEVEACDTKQGKEEITRDIPNVGEDALANLDESGIVRIGATVTPGDILVGKITPKGETQLSPEEKLLKAIFGEKAGDVRDTSLTVPPGVEGTIVGVRVFSRRGADKDERMQAIEDEDVARIEKDIYDEIKIVEEERDKKIRRHLVGKTTIPGDVSNGKGSRRTSRGTKLTEKALGKLSGKALLDVRVKESALVHEHVLQVADAAKQQIDDLKKTAEEKSIKLRRGDELPPGVIKMVKVYVAMKRKLSVGDKMAGRHGNKGVVSIIVPEEDMPYMADGTPIDLILNPLGVPSRMNVGQILETHLGWAVQKLGLPVATPVFDGATEKDIKDALSQAALPENGRVELFDGKSGVPFDQKVVVGQIYMMKLHHLVDDKIHARSTGPYSLVTQQPLGGKAQFGGQRLGEMEVWALEAYGAARTLQEMLTVKSDDVAGRTRMYEAIVKGENTLEASLPESFNVLVKELQSLALDVELLEASDVPQDDQWEEMSE